MRAPIAILSTIFVLLPSAALAHEISGSDAHFVEAIQGPAIAPFMYLGAKHMVTGTDHLLFLVGVIFFLYRARDVLLYVTLFTLGHSATLLAGALGEIRVDAHLVDAVIGLSVVYKAFENMQGFQKVFGIEPNTRVAVLVFGLCHGLGLATKLQELTLSNDGLVMNILSFNVGVEIGQGLALGAILLAMTTWRQSTNFQRHAFAANGLLMMGGFVLTGTQLVGYFLDARISA